MQEIWKAIEGTGGKYEVSNTGKVRSLNYLGHGKTQELKLAEDHKGYLRVRIFYGKKRRTEKVHRLVAIAFIPNPGNKPEVNHKDGNKKRNYDWNLEWSTTSENTQHAYNHGLKEETRAHCREMGMTIGRENLARSREKRKTPIIAIDTEGKELFFNSQAEAARELKVSQPNIHRALNDSRRTVGGYRWRHAAGGGE